MTLFLLIIFGIYFLLLLALIAGWQKVIKKERSSSIGKHHTITVIIPFRNEMENLAALANDLILQNYPAQQFSVLFVNDHSDDQSVQLLNQQIGERINFKIVSLPDELQGKKKAIDFGINLSDAEIIVTTDADCRVSSTWLTIINNYFQQDHTKFVFGGVAIRADSSFFSKLQSLEFASLIGSGAATLALHMPTMCNGANLAYRRAAYQTVRGFEGNFQIPSGDDEFLMRKIESQFPGSVRFINEQDSVVSTKSQRRVHDFFQQRIRWAGKWKYNASWSSRLLALMVLLFQITWLSVLCLVFFGEIRGDVAGVVITGKVIPELIFLYRVVIFMRQKFNPVYFVVLQFVYPVYVILIGFLSQVRSYSWKGRSLSHRM